MKKIKLAIALVSLSICAGAQSPEISSWIHNTTGITGSYYDMSGTLNSMTDLAYCQEVCYNADSVWVHCSGVYEEMAAWVNPGTPSDQNHEFRIPRAPIAATGPNTEVSFVGEVAFLVNGVPIFGMGDGNSYESSSNSMTPMGDDLWHGNAFETEGFTLNDMGAHPAMGSLMHSHALATPLWDDVPVTEHSPIVGYAFDGFPIYGPYGYSSATDSNSAVELILSSYRERTMTDRTTFADGSSSIPAGPSDFSTYPIGYFVEDFEYVSGLGHLDEHNGRFCVTPEYPGGTYAYFTTIDPSGQAAFPFYIGPEYYGEVDQANVSGGFQWPSVCTVTSLEEEHENSIELYPNPTNGIFNVGATGNVSITVFNLMGAIVHQSAGSQVDLSDEPQGTYIVTVQTDNGSYRLPVVVQH